MWGHPEFVPRVHEYVAARSHDPKYRRAFASYTPLRESLAPGTTTSGVPHQVQPLRARWVIVGVAVARWCTAAWRAIDSALAWIVRPAVAPTAEADPIPEQLASTPEPEPQPPAAVESCGATIKFQVVIRAHCVAGRQIDEDGVDRGICPSCLAWKGKS